VSSTSRGVRIRVREGLCIEAKSDPCGLVIFGASGDLTRRKLFPSLTYLKEHGLLPGSFYALGAARSAMTDAEIRSLAPELDAVYYLRGDYDDAAAYRELKERMRALDKTHQTGGNAIFYLAVPPELYPVILRGLGDAGLLDGAAPGGWARVIIEKPFGRDLASAMELETALGAYLREDQIYRIDHYLGKETVQNILLFRFANSIFEPIWNRSYIDHVQISVLESIGVEKRAGYYDQSGVVRDMCQNHMTQLLALTAMEAPTSFAADHVRDEKSQVFRSINPLAAENVVLGQYAGYRSEAGVSPNSRTPTYAALRVDISNWRWEGVPFYLRTGKKLGKRAAEIAVTFKRVPHSLIPQLRPEDLEPNVLVFRIQPDEGISLSFEAKKPGPKLCLGALTMDFDYDEVFGEDPPEAYQRLLLDCMQGDQTLFIRRDAVKETWRLVEPLLDSKKFEPAFYDPGSPGPAAADALIGRDGRKWRL